MPFTAPVRARARLGPASSRASRSAARFFSTLACLLDAEAAENSAARATCARRGFHLLLSVGQRVVQRAELRADVGSELLMGKPIEIHGGGMVPTRST